VVALNTGHYQSDFELDREKIIQAATSDNEDDKYLLWLSRRSGTVCVQERDAFLNGSDAHIHWTHYKGTTGNLAFIIEIADMEDDKPVGTLYEIDYDVHAEHVEKASHRISTVLLSFENGDRLRFPYEKLSGKLHLIREKYGEIVGSLREPKDEHALQVLLKEERDVRHRFPAHSFAMYIKRLSRSKKIVSLT
jgi:hypothetical protein